MKANREVEILSMYYTWTKVMKTKPVTIVNLERNHVGVKWHKAEGLFT